MFFKVIYVFGSTVAEIEIYLIQCNYNEDKKLNYFVKKSQPFDYSKLFN